MPSRVVEVGDDGGIGDDGDGEWVEMCRVVWVEPREGTGRGGREAILFGWKRGKEGGRGAKDRR